MKYLAQFVLNTMLYCVLWVAMVLMLFGICYSFIYLMENFITWKWEPYTHNFKNIPNWEGIERFLLFLYLGFLILFSGRITWLMVYSNDESTI